MLHEVLHEVLHEMFSNTEDYLHDVAKVKKLTNDFKKDELPR